MRPVPGRDSRFLCLCARDQRDLGCKPDRQLPLYVLVCGIVGSACESQLRFISLSSPKPVLSFLCSLIKPELQIGRDSLDLKLFTPAFGLYQEFFSESRLILPVYVQESIFSRLGGNALARTHRVFVSWQMQYSGKNFQ